MTSWKVNRCICRHTYVKWWIFFDDDIRRSNDHHNKTRIIEKLWEDKADQIENYDRNSKMCQAKYKQKWMHSYQTVENRYVKMLLHISVKPMLRWFDSSNVWNFLKWAKVWKQYNGWTGVAALCIKVNSIKLKMNGYLSSIMNRDIYENVEMYRHCKCR